LAAVKSTTVNCAAILAPKALPRDLRQKNGVIFRTPMQGNRAAAGARGRGGRGEGGGKERGKRRRTGRTFALGLGGGEAAGGGIMGERGMRTVRGWLAPGLVSTGSSLLVEGPLGVRRDRQDLGPLRAAVAGEPRPGDERQQLPVGHGAEEAVELLGGARRGLRH